MDLCGISSTVQNLNIGIFTCRDRINGNIDAEKRRGRRRGGGGGSPAPSILPALLSSKLKTLQDPLESSSQ
jgi:hypothetical protein